MTFAFTLALLCAAPTAPRFGVTADGKSVLFPKVEEIRSEDQATSDEVGETELLCTLDETVVHDLGTLAETTYLFASQGTQCSGAGKRANLQSRAGLDTWLKAHPLTSLRGPTGPKGTRFQGSHANCAELKCTGASCVAQYANLSHCQDEGANNYMGGIDVGFKRPDGRVFPLVVGLRVGMGMMAFRSAETFEVSWLPDETQAVVVHTYEETGGRASTIRVTGFDVVRFSDVRVSVLGYADPNASLDKKGQKPTADDAAHTAAAALRKLGGFAVATGHTRDPHTETVVFAAAGFEAVAKKVAVALGNAKIQPLNWKVDADLVIACVAK